MSLKQLKSLTLKYSDRIAPLLSLGKHGVATEESIDYVGQFGFTQEDIPELLQLAQDTDIYMFDYSDMSDDEGWEFYGVIHAWYALSQMEAPEAKEIFIHLIENTHNGFSDDWILSGFRELIKPYRQEIYPYFIKTTLSEKHDQWVRVEYLNVLRDMAQAGEIETSIIDTLIESILKNSKDEIINTMAISACIKLKLSHHHELIVQCFKNDLVDIDHIGDLEDVEIALGLKTKREHPRQPTKLQKMFESVFARNVSVSCVREEPKIGRNDPCPCGSGKKYKKCCQNKSES